MKKTQQMAQNTHRSMHKVTNKMLNGTLHRQNGPNNIACIHLQVCVECVYWHVLQLDGQANMYMYIHIANVNGNADDIYAIVLFAFGVNNIVEWHGSIVWGNIRKMTKYCRRAQMKPISGLRQQKQPRPANACNRGLFRLPVLIRLESYCTPD